MPKKQSRRKDRMTVRGMLGLGLDGDGQTRITRTDEMVLVGGSQETHERMQETAIRFSELLESSGQRLQDTPVQEVVSMLRQAIEKTS